MAVSKNRKFARIANDVAADGTLTAAGISSDVTLGGAEAFADVNSLPGNPSLGDLAFVTSTNTLYVYSGSAWFNIAIANQAPTAISGNSASYSLATDGTPTIVTLVSNDPEGFPLTWSATTSGDTQVGTLTQADNVFTVTPSTDEADAGTLSVTFSVTDGSNTETSISSFTLQFSVAIEYLIVGGGGGGGTGWAGGGGGGAGGSVLTGSYNLTPGTYNIYIGSGGAGGVNANGDTNGDRGGFSRFAQLPFEITAGGGGGGGGFNQNNTGSPPLDGSATNWNGAGADATGAGIGDTSGGQGNGTGFDGGNSFNGAGDRAAGGGAGAGGNGGNAATGGYAGNGGPGVSSDITGSSVFYGAGGGGGVRTGAGVEGLGGSGGAGGRGGDGINNVIATDASTPGSGGGGGAGTTNASYPDGGDGAAGIIVIKTTATATAVTGSPTLTTDGGFNIYTYTQDGTITF